MESASGVSKCRRKLKLVSADSGGEIGWLSSWRKSSKKWREMALASASAAA
jgi:predicted alpha/beta-fold hydrolase